MNLFDLILADHPTTRIYPSDQPSDQRRIAVEDRPELEHQGIRYRAYFETAPNGIDGMGLCESSAVEDLWRECELHDELLREREPSNWSQRYPR